MVTSFHFLYIGIRQIFDRYLRPGTEEKAIQVGKRLGPEICLSENVNFRSSSRFRSHTFNISSSEAPKHSKKNRHKSENTIGA